MTSRRQRGSSRTRDVPRDVTTSHISKYDQHEYDPEERQHAKHGGGFRRVKDADSGDSVVVTKAEGTYAEIIASSPSDCRLLEREHILCANIDNLTVKFKEALMFCKKKPAYDTYKVWHDAISYLLQVYNPRRLDMEFGLLSAGVELGDCTIDLPNGKTFNCLLLHRNDDIKLICSQFVGRLTHDNGGVLQNDGSDVRVRVPAGAVPEGKTYIIVGNIHTRLTDYNHCMHTKDEYIAGPVVELYVEEGGTFDKHVEIIIPHCARRGKTEAVRVLYGSGNIFQYISADKDMSYSVQDDFVLIQTKHFTKFIVTDTNTVREITDALVTVAASHERTDRKSVIGLRLMLHSHCAGMNDFSSERSMFYDPGMDEIKRLKVSLPDRDKPIHFPKIRITLTVDDGLPWQIYVPCETTPTDSHKQETIILNGRDMLKLPDTGVIVRHRSESLHDFNLYNNNNNINNNNNNSDLEQLSCSLDVDFQYDDHSRIQSALIIYPATPKTCEPSESLSPNTKQLLKKTEPELMKRITLSPLLWSELVKNDVLTNSEVGEIKGGGNTSDQDKIAKLIQHVQRDPGGRFQGFLQSLVETGQGFVVTDILNHPLPKPAYPEVRTANPVPELPSLRITAPVPTTRPRRKESATCTHAESTSSLSSQNDKVHSKIPRLTAQKTSQKAAHPHDELSESCQNMQKPTAALAPSPVPPPRRRKLQKHQ